MPYPKRQIEVMEFIIAFKKENDGNSPRLEEIASHFGISRQSVHQRINEMNAKHWLRLDHRGRINLGGGYMPPEPNR